VRERLRIGIDLFSINERKMESDQELGETMRILGAFPGAILFIEEPEANQRNTKDRVVRGGEFQQ
jgi:hypothetical protein